MIFFRNFSDNPGQNVLVHPVKNENVLFLHM